MSLVALLKGNGSSGFGYGSTAEEVTAGLDLTGRTYLVTGCSSGLGKETVRVLALRGARIVGAARTEGKAAAALRDARAKGVAVACDLSEPSSVRAAVDRIAGLDQALDAIIANAGIMALPKLEQKHGYELQFLTNHIGHFILVTGLLDRLAADGRVVILSSAAHNRAPRGGIQFDNLSGEKGYTPWGAYGQSKLANLLFARQLAKRLADSNRVANSVHPGVIATNLGRHLPAVAKAGFSLAGPVFFKSIPQGAATQCYVATHPAAAAASGEYWADCNRRQPSHHADDARLAERLWEVSEEIAAKVV